MAWRGGRSSRNCHPPDRPQSPLRGRALLAGFALDPAELGRVSVLAGIGDGVAAAATTRPATAHFTRAALFTTGGVRNTVVAARLEAGVARAQPVGATGVGHTGDAGGAVDAAYLVVGSQLAALIIGAAAVTTGRGAGAEPAQTFLPLRTAGDTLPLLTALALTALAIAAALPLGNAASGTEPPPRPAPARALAADLARTTLLVAAALAPGDAPAPALVLPLWTAATAILAGGPPAAGEVPLRGADLAQAPAWRRRLLGDGVGGGEQDAGFSPRRLHHMRAVLRTGLNQAIKWGLVGRNAAALTEPVRQAPRTSSRSHRRKRGRC